MKIITNPIIAILTLTILAVAACKKTDTPLTSPLVNTGPIAKAGKDTSIILPTNFVLLDGIASIERENSITSYLWKLLSGPSTTITFEKKGIAQMMIKDLVKGIYQFELTVKDTRGLSSRDTVQVSVLEPDKPRPGIISDTTIHLPYNHAALYIAFDNDNIQNINSFSWKKISGPNLSSILYPGDRWTIVENLVEGTYKFEITTTNTYWNWSAKDTMTVTVLPDNNIYTNEIVIDSLNWSCPFGCTATINNISSIIPIGRPFKVYVRPSPFFNWEIASPGLSDLYDNAFFIGNNAMSLWVFDEAVSQSGAIKVVY